MKKVIYSLLGLLAIFSFAACSDDDNDNPYEHTSTIAITSQDITFQAAGGNGTVTVNSTNGISGVKSSESWCTATFDGNVVSVKADPNKDFNGRSSLLTIYSGTDSVNVTAQQLGIVFSIQADSLINVNDDAQRKTYAFNSNVDVKVSSSADWLTASADSDSLVVNAAANESGKIRSAYVYYQVGEMVDSMKVIQGSLQDFLNKQFIFGGYNIEATGDDDRFNSLLVTLESDNGDLVLHQASRDWNIPVTFDENTLSISVNAGQLIGGIITYYLYSWIASEDGYLTVSRFASMTGKFDYEPELDGAYADIVDDGTFTGKTSWLYGFELQTRRSTNSSYTAQQTFMTFAYPFIWEYTASNAKAFNAYKKSVARKVEAKKNIFQN